MDQYERQELKRLATAVGEMGGGVAVLTQKIESLVEQRNEDGKTALRVATLVAGSCKERHTAINERIDHLERSERRFGSRWNKLSGMVAPTAVFVALIAVLIKFLG